MIKYGLISETDGRTIEKTIDLVLLNFTELSNGNRQLIPPFNPICITEIGLFDCGTVNGIFSYLSTKCAICYTGIDNEFIKPINAPEWLNYIKGNSNEVYNQLEDNSQHLIFIDGNHSFPYVVSDFYCYADKVKTGGYLAFHDTGKHIKPMSGYQGVGSKEDPDMYVAVRKALAKMRLIDSPTSCMRKKWELVFDEADENDEFGGICVFKKLY